MSEISAFDKVFEEGAVFSIITVASLIYVTGIAVSVILF